MPSALGVSVKTEVAVTLNAAINEIATLCTSQMAARYHDSLFRIKYHSIEKPRFGSDKNTKLLRKSF